MRGWMGLFFFAFCRLIQTCPYKLYLDEFPKQSYGMVEAISIP